MDYSKIKTLGLKEAARGYAEKIGRENSIRVIQAPSLDFGIRQLVFDLVNNNVVGLWENDEPKWVRWVINKAIGR